MGQKTRIRYLVWREGGPYVECSNALTAWFYRHRLGVSIRVPFLFPVYTATILRND